MLGWFQMTNGFQGDGSWKGVIVVWKQSRKIVAVCTKLSMFWISTFLTATNFKISPSQCFCDPKNRAHAMGRKCSEIGQGWLLRKRSKNSHYVHFVFLEVGLQILPTVTYPQTRFQTNFWRQFHHCHRHLHWLHLHNPMLPALPVAGIVFKQIKMGIRGNCCGAVRGNSDLTASVGLSSQFWTIDIWRTTISVSILHHAVDSSIPGVEGSVPWGCSS